MPPKKPAKPKFLPMHTESPFWPEIDDFLKEEIGKRRPKPKEIERVALIADLLRQEYPDADCALHFNGPWQLLVATILSAQCTDERVNMVTPVLWKKYPAPADFVAAPPGALEEDIRSTGFFNNKAKAIRETARQIVDEFGGRMPRTMEELTSLRGAARKTANVVRMHAYELPGMSVDTHFTRLAGRLGISKAIDPVKIEADAAALLPPEHWTAFSSGLIWHGRRVCAARKPLCEQCVLQDLCPSAFKVKVPPVKRATAKGKAT